MLESQKPCELNINTIKVIIVNIKSLVPVALVVTLLGATVYMAMDKGLPGSGMGLVGEANAKELSPANAKQSFDDIKKNILANVKVFDPTIQDIQIEQSPVQGVYWVLLPKNEMILISEDGRYVLGRGVNEFKNGDLQPVQSKILMHALENTRKTIKEDFISTADTQLVYPAEGKKKSEVYVFTDVNCGYCRKFHGEISELNKAGIEVRYFAGPFYSKDRSSLERIWCAKDPLEAMDITKSGRKAPDAEVSDTCISTISQHIKIGERLGIRGTPAIFTLEGDKLGGYLPASQIIQRLVGGS